MGRRGPAPKPTAIKELQGNPGKRPINRDEPQPPVAERPPSVPRWLSEDAKKEWRRHAGPLWEVGLLTESDYDILALYCETFAAWKRAEIMVRAKGLVIKTTNGNMIQNPYLAIANRAKKDALVLMRELGLTPSARTRISLPKDDDAEPSLAELLFQGVNDGA